MITEISQSSLSGSEYNILGPPPSTHPPRVVAVACSTRPIHVADYFSGLDQLFSMQHEYPSEAFYVISDNDVFARDQSPCERREAMLNTASACLALGLDEKKAVLYRQSDLPQALQLLWSMPSSTVAYSVEGASARFLYGDVNYLPVDHTALFAANGLVIRGTIMAGTADQIDGFYYARHLAQQFDDRYGKQVLTCPGARLVGPQDVIRRDAPTYSSDEYISLSPFACRRELEERLSRAFAYSKLNGTGKRIRARLANLQRSVCSDVEEQMSFEEQLAAGREYNRLTKMLAAKIVAYFSTAAARYEVMREHSDYVWDILREGAYLASLQADGTLAAVRQAIGAA